MGAGVIDATCRPSYEKVGRPERPIVLVPCVRTEGQLTPVQFEGLARSLVERKSHRFANRRDAKTRIVLGRVLDDVARERLVVYERNVEGEESVALGPSARSGLDEEPRTRDKGLHRRQRMS